MYSLSILFPFQASSNAFIIQKSSTIDALHPPSFLARSLSSLLHSCKCVCKCGNGFLLHAMQMGVMQRRYSKILYAKILVPKLKKKIE